MRQKASRLELDGSEPLDLAFESAWLELLLLRSRSELEIARLVRGLVAASLIGIQNTRGREELGSSFRVQIYLMLKMGRFLTICFPDPFSAWCGMLLRQESDSGSIV